ncbi:MAG: M24 family metallopeptidase [Promethearchaeota archaeon]
MLDDKVYKKRMKLVAEELGRMNVDFAFVAPSPAFQYLTGIRREASERLIALIIIPDSNPRIVAPAFEVSTLTQHTWINDFVAWAEDQDPYKVLVETAGISTAQPSVAFEDTTSLGVYRLLKESFGRFESISTLTPFINGLRQLKSEEELSLMEKAGHIINDAVLAAFESTQLGMSELQLQRIVNDAIVQAGATPTFAAIQFGENSALPHATAGNRELKKNDIILMDCGCTLGGYNTDMTRVGVVGPPTDEQRKIHSIVLEAEKTAISKIEPGLACGAADGIARRVIEEAGYGEYFTHRLGHGIGLEVHEQPYLVRGNSQLLESGMTHSVEPGIYLEGKFGIRIEDLVCVRSGGAELLTFMPRDLFIVDL